MKKIDVEKTGQRGFDIQGLHKNVFCRPNAVVWSWGAHAFKKLGDKIYRFKVNGHHHKGHVYITLNWNDTFHLYFTTTRGTIIREIEEVYVDQLITRIDEVVEKIDTYNF